MAKENQFLFSELSYFGCYSLMDELERFDVDNSTRFKHLE